MEPTTTLPGTALALIHTGEAPTRSALTAKLGVTRATTGAITGELRDLRLIEVEATPGGGHLGRPSHRLQPDPDGPVALAAEIHTDGFAVALIGLGAVTVARRQPRPAGPGRPRAGPRPGQRGGRGAAARSPAARASAPPSRCRSRSPSRAARPSARSTSAGRTAPR